MWHIDPVVYGRLNDRDITVTNVNSFADADSYADIYDYYAALIDSVATHLPECVETIAKSELESGVVSFMALDEDEETFILANQKAIEIYETELDYEADINDIGPVSDEYRTLNQIVLELVPSEMVDGVSDKIEQRVDLESMDGIKFKE